MLIECSLGEVIDKYTILELKLKNLSGPADEHRVGFIQRELDLISIALRKNNLEAALKMASDLRDINAELWDTLSEQVKLGKSIDLGTGASVSDIERYAHLSQKISRLNHKRSVAKEHINMQFLSEFHEVKVY